MQVVEGAHLVLQQQEHLVALEVVVQVQALLVWQLLVHLIQAEVEGAQTKPSLLCKAVTVAQAS
jgi:hypothetical protein